MTLVRLGYAAMSMNVQNGSPSQTMTHAQFSKIGNREAAIHKLERIAMSNLHNCLRLLRHNAAHDIHFFRLSSKLIPMANHPELSDWNYIKPLGESLKAIRSYLKEHQDMRIDFHPDHFVVLNSPKPDILKTAVQTLRMHRLLLKGMGIAPEHRCVVHVGGGYRDKEAALEQFVENWGLLPAPLQRMIMLENDDKTFTINETLYLCEKLGVPAVFDYHHHAANHEKEAEWEAAWERVTATWQSSALPVKMHMSSPKSEEDFRAHADFIDEKEFLHFLHRVKGSVPQIDVMIEAKQKDNALFALVRELKKAGIEQVDGASFYMQG
ncbi:UV DNA damage repair endonuclease UvsE [Domibacillus sp. DTU_2020_1001157_1_SI_ALB_TIR_016]|uniref:UV DNA damage repair endonuclease UvsE n=1 Tax=Domibacillus sp. DTU_2020_1001157_1_SI_ALB_TIR_016 TaxID=3077789 RepID=UPI0028E7076B|nr:UV DNA damage repair endonuclease UvsE [Domibacillus sp. DTU_2020_1001157_1_SI_ALB_TIR_016]WNS80359.1 UV DNA damage repair endonuclease UvsE [Domibacillus sp. DTU_2020_1001157_1_SI_ALB_TIR_016]